MDITNQKDLFNYLYSEEPINPVKNLFGAKDNFEDDSEKENTQKISRVRDECGQIVNQTVEKEQNRQLCSNISDLKSFYRANEISKIDDCSDTLSSNTRNQLLKDWIEKKNIESNNENKLTLNILSERKGNINSSAEKQKDYLTQAQIMQKYFNSRVGYGDGTNTTHHKTITKPQSPKFQTTTRSAIHALKNKSIEELERSNSKNSGRKIDPKNFYLETDKRAKSRIQTPIKEEEYEFKARPKPEYKHFELQKSEHKQIEFKEFLLNTQERGRSKEQQLKTKLENEKKQDEQLRQFHAKDIPDYTELSSKYINNKQYCSPRPTLPIDFKFETEKRIGLGLRKTLFSQSEEKYEFKARLMPDFQKTKSPAKPSPKKVTIPVGVKLQSTLRAEERKLFDEQMEIKLQKQKELSVEEDKNKEEDDEDELKNYPKFKAQPIKRYKHFEVQKSDIALTQPESPKFLIDLRKGCSEKQKEIR